MNLGLDRVVAIGDRRADNLLRAGQKLAGKQLNELVLDILDEVKLGHALVIHDEDCKEAMRVFDARICHLDENVGILLEVDHEFLLLLHVAELVLVYVVRVVEEQVVLTCQLNLHLVDLVGVGSVEEENFYSDGFECAYFLGALARILNS